MASLQDFNDRLQQIRNRIEAELPNIATTIALSAKGMAERNILDTGIGEQYSTDKYPAWYLHGKELNGAGRTFLAQRGVSGAGVQGEPKKKRRKKKGDPDPGRYDTLTNWREFREAQGLPSQHVNLHYSNRMYSNLQPVSIERQGAIVKALLGATNREDQEKMNWNFQRYGDFIGKALTPANFETLEQVAAEELRKIMQQLNP